MTSDQPSPRTYNTTVDALTAAIQGGDGVRTAVLAREAVYMKTQQLCMSAQPAKPHLSKNKNKKHKKGKDTPAPLSKKQYRELAIKTVRKVIAKAIEHENAYNLARDILNDAVRKNVKSIDFDHVARENAMKQRVRNLIDEKVGATDELRARLIELGDGCLPPRERYFVHDKMDEYRVKTVKNQEIRELNTHLGHFEGSLKTQSEKWLARRVESRYGQDSAINELADAMAQLSAAYCSDTKDNSEDGSNDGGMELDIDEVM